MPMVHTEMEVGDELVFPVGMGPYPLGSFYLLIPFYTENSKVIAELCLMVVSCRRKFYGA